ncbi:hypothetical protein ACJX0J_029306, partial [Zea mays]
MNSRTLFHTMLILLHVNNVFLVGSIKKYTASSMSYVSVLQQMWKNWILDINHIIGSWASTSDLGYKKLLLTKILSQTNIINCAGYFQRLLQKMETHQQMIDLALLFKHVAVTRKYPFCLSFAIQELKTSIDARNGNNAVLAHIMLREKLHIFGILGCILCVVGSTTIVLHAPPERQIESVAEVWDLATEPAFLFYAAVVFAAAFVLICHFVPQYGQTHIMVYIGICSLVGSLSVMSVKALGIALKVTFSGMNQLVYSQTWVFSFVVILCIVTQMNYLNKALDTFNTAVVSPIYYTMFTSLTILASVIMFKDWDRQNPTQIVTEMCGFVTILSGTFLLHKTKDMVDGLPPNLPIRLPKHADEDGYADDIIPLRSAAD